MENSQATLQEHTEPRNAPPPKQTLTGRVCAFSVSLEVSASSFFTTPERFAAVFATVVNFSYLHGIGGHLDFRLWIKSCGGREEGGATPKTSPALSFPLRRHTYTYAHAPTNKQTNKKISRNYLFGPGRWYRLHGRSIFFSSPHFKVMLLRRAGGRNWCSVRSERGKKKKKLERKSVPPQLEKEAVVRRPESPPRRGGSAGRGTRPLFFPFPHLAN